MCIYTYVSIYMCIYLYIDEYIYILIYLYKTTCIYTYIYLHVYVYIHTSNTHTHVSIYIHTHIFPKLHLTYVYSIPAWCTGEVYDFGSLSCILLMSHLMAGNYLMQDT